MKFSDRTAQERTAITAWIRIMNMVREDGCMKISDDFKAEREKSISESIDEGDIAQMVGFYAAYQQSRHDVSYTQYFQAANPEAYAAIVLDEQERKT